MKILVEPNWNQKLKHFVEKYQLAIYINFVAEPKITLTHQNSRISSNNIFYVKNPVFKTKEKFKRHVSLGLVGNSLAIKGIAFTSN